MIFLGKHLEPFVVSFEQVAITRAIRMCIITIFFMENSTHQHFSGD